MSLMQPVPEFLRGVKTPRVLMLLYHRIGDGASDPQLLSVTQKHFDEHLEVLTRYRALNCFDIASIDGQRSFSTNAVAVTFDDGYADNLTNALPILQKYDTPAAVFISTGMVQERKQFWWDELTRIVFGAQKLPAVIELKLDKICRWNFAEIGNEHPHENATPKWNWNLLSKSDPTVMHAFYRQVSQYLRNTSGSERERVLGELRSWSGRGLSDLPMPRAMPSITSTATIGSGCNALTEEQIIELANSGFVEIGSHTVNHPVLAGLSEQEQRSELLTSKKFLESLIGREVHGFAFPYGTRADYTSETVSIVKEVSYKYACSNIAEVIWPGTDRFQLPRLLVRDCDGDYFQKWLSEWFGEN
jgi:peptidoglycan/xylan/chitin deacetylase (PgdA/CDA1 family)